MVGSNKKHGKTRNNRRHQRGGMLSPQNIADQLIYPYMHDDPFYPYEALSQYNTSAFKLFVANHIDPIRRFTIDPTSEPDYTIFTIKGQKFIDFGKYLRTAYRSRFDQQHASLLRSISLPDELPSGWVMTKDNQYVNIFTNQKQAGKPTKEADGKDMWSLGKQAAQIKATAIVRPTLTADKTNIIAGKAGEKIHITPLYRNSATLMLTIGKPPIIANSDVNAKAADVKNGLTSEYIGKPFIYNEELQPGTYVLQLIGDDSSKSDPLTFTVEEPKSSGSGGKTRRYKRRPCKRTRKH